MAYNRDEAETFGIERALQAGYNEINSTAPDVLDKKMKEIDKYIQKRAMEKARNTANQVMSEREQRGVEKEENMEDLIRQMATAILRENEAYLGKEVAKESIEKIEKEKAAKEKKGGNKNGNKTTKASTTRRTTRTNQE